MIPSMVNCTVPIDGKDTPVSCQHKGDGLWKCDNKDLPNKGKVVFATPERLNKYIMDDDESLEDLCKRLGASVDGIDDWQKSSWEGDGCNLARGNGCACEVCKPCKTPRSIVDAILDEIPNKGRGSSCNAIVEDAFSKARF